MKLIIAVVQNEDADNVVDALLEAEYRATRLASTGGFLRRGNTTIMIGVQ
ncbi:MAG: cyclic-di-AMP receptor, partial [Thermomicrobia bacterium]|nr:cyclic-di-AMP receptor [Thermomicrobia bacterium]MCA1722698.1 cyclic-di-AMP receptor [Thermomicrobia bacterium]